MLWPNTFLQKKYRQNDAEYIIIVPSPDSNCFGSFSIFPFKYQSSLYIIYMYQKKCMKITSCIIKRVIAL